MKKRWLILFLAAPALLLTTAVIASLTIGEVEHEYNILACVSMDPEAGTTFSHDLEPNGEKRHIQFVTNTCENNITVGIEANKPNVDYLEFSEWNTGEFSLSSGETHKATVTVHVGNDAPVGPAPSLFFEITRPE